MKRHRSKTNKYDTISKQMHKANEKRNLRTMQDAPDEELFTLRALKNYRKEYNA